MSAITRIVDTINGVLEKARTPIIPIPAILLLCSVFKRPGLSPMMMASRIIKRQSEFGANTGVLPNGESNMMNSLISVICEEVVREVQTNCVIESVVAPGTIFITGEGANAGGPVVITGTNTNPVKATGLPR